MSNDTAEKVASAHDIFMRGVRAAGVAASLDPIMGMIFLLLPVIPMFAHPPGGYVRRDDVLLHELTLQSGMGFIEGATPAGSMIAVICAIVSSVRYLFDHLAQPIDKLPVIMRLRKSRDVARIDEDSYERVEQLIENGPFA